MKWYKHIVFFLGMMVVAWSSVSLEIQNVDIDAGTLDIYMTNQAGCSFCDDPLYNTQALCELNGNNTAGGVWTFDTTIDEATCESSTTNGVYFDGQVGGFQFELIGITITDATAPDGFVVSTSATIALAFSMTGATIPAGEGILTQVSFTSFNGESICFGEDTGGAGNTAIAAADGGYIAAEWGPCFIAGCMDMDACNYNADADIEDGSCEDAEENYDCDGNCTVATDVNGSCCSLEDLDDCDICGGDDTACIDCFGITNGDAEWDNCDTCDSDPSNDCVQDCAGIWGGISVSDVCAICNGDDSSCADCAGVPNGDSILDNCGTCDSDPFNDCEQDCFGIFNGLAEYDECDPPVCTGGTTGLVANSSCLDCAGVPNGNSYEDNCGGCDANTVNDCVQDCAGIWGGGLVDDDCNVCDGDSSTCIDCNGDVNGDAYFDFRYVCTVDPTNNTTKDTCEAAGGQWIPSSLCVGGNTGEAASLLDCEGLGLSDDDWEGPGAYDNCDVCDSDSSNDCVQDCAGEWGGDAEDDECEVCDGDNSLCLDCAGVPNGLAYEDDCEGCDANIVNDCVKDCAGVPDGSAEYDECGVCRNTDDSNWNTTCADCAGVPNGSNVYDQCLGCDANTVNDCVKDCAGKWGGSAEWDECDTPVCTGGTTELVANSSCLDCAGVPNGSAEYDECDPPVCTGGTTGLVSSCLDCADVPYGDNVVDNCGTCDNDDSNNCVQDCADEWGGDAEIKIMYIDLDGDGLGSGPEIEFCDLYMPDGDLFVENTTDLEPNCETNDTDDCGVCGGDGTTCNSSSDIDCAGLVGGTAVEDCAGDCEGTATIDSCGLCTGGDTGLTPDYLQDECGICNGSGIPDEECDCDGNIEDCAGVCGGIGEWDLYGACCTATEESPCILTWCDIPDSTVYLTDTSMVFKSSKAIKQIKLTLEGSVISSLPQSGAAGDAGFIRYPLTLSDTSNWVKLAKPGATIPAGSCGNLFNIDYDNIPVSISVEIKDENNIVIGFSSYFDSGCSEESACNYNPFSSEDFDGACNYPEDGFNCDGNELAIINPGLIPETYNIYNIYPNPFNPVTNIEFGLPANAFVQIIVYDIKGRQIATLMNSFQFTGYYSLIWDASDSPSGVYFIDMTSDGFKQTRQVVLMK